MSSNYANRDIQCAADVGYMAKLGRFGHEFTVYGCAARKKEGQIYYCAADNEQKLYDYIDHHKMSETYFTPIIRQSERKMVPAGNYEPYMYQAKYNILQQMKRAYEESGFFQEIAGFLANEPNNNGQQLLQEYQQKIRGNFDEAELQLFAGAVHQAYQAKILYLESYRHFLSWIAYIKKQMEDTPVIEEKFKRTFYGFAYIDSDGKQQVFLDADIITVIHRRQDKILQGFIVAPILQKTYWSKQLNAFSSARDEYKQWLLKYQNDDYFSLLFKLKQQHGVIDGTALQKTQEKLKQYHTANIAVQYCNMQWNKIQEY